MTSRTEQPPASVELTTIELPMAPISRQPGLPILHGGGRTATPEELSMLGADVDHAQRPATVLPYRSQRAYGRDIEPARQRAAILDNGLLRAVFLPDLGGRLWQLTDLATGQELLHQPDAIRPANLALRNAWFAGGVEWNLGVTGHWGLTCEPVQAAVVRVEGMGGAEGVEVLRLWAYERMLGLVWRLDAWLPPGQDRLHVHVVLDNPGPADVPVYWWSNAAVPQAPGGRVAVNADSAFHFGYSDRLTPVPVPGDPDVTRPDLARHSADYFFETDHEHPWIASLDAEGHGLGQVSTARLRSRKLFVWGEAAGGHTWQRWLSGDRSYVEIQAGLARTQLEHLRLPAGETWSWTESYGPVHADADRVAGPWRTAVEEVRRQLVDQDALRGADEVLARVAGLPVPPAEVSGADGWGALAVAVGDLPDDPSVPFPAELDAEQRAWLELARTGRVADELVGSVLTGAPWLERLRAADPGPVQRLLQGYAEHAAGDTATARDLWRASVAEEPTASALRALAVTGEAADAAGLLGQAVARAEGAVQSGELSPVGADELVIEYLTALRQTCADAELLRVVDDLPARQRDLPRVVYLTCAALVATGDGAAAQQLLDRPIVMPDLREGDLSLDQLWADHQRLVGRRDLLPAHYDFRMHVEDGEGTQP